VLAGVSGGGVGEVRGDREAFAAGHIPKSYSVWAAGLPVLGGWIAGPSTPVYLVLSTIDALSDAVLSLARIGVDNVAGVLAGGFDQWRNEGLPVARSGALTPREVERMLGNVRVLDVREDSEFEQGGHIPHASHLYVGYLEKHLRRITPPLDASARIAVTCSVGHRASLAASILRREGFEHVDNLLGGMTAWKKLELPIERGKEHTVTTPEIEGERK
jgi:hydroxyacylglutathione hydrolase